MHALLHSRDHSLPLYFTRSPSPPFHPPVPSSHTSLISVRLLLSLMKNRMSLGPLSSQPSPPSPPTPSPEETCYVWQWSDQRGVVKWPFILHWRQLANVANWIPKLFPTILLACTIRPITSIKRQNNFNAKKCFPIYRIEMSLHSCMLRRSLLWAIATYIYTHTYIHTYIHTYTYIHIYMYTYMYTHTYIHTYIQTYNKDILCLC